MSTAPLLTPIDLAAVLKLTVKKTLELRRLNDWPHVRLGRQIRFTEEQAQRIVASCIPEAAAATLDEQRPAPVFNLTPGSRRAAKRAAS